MQAKVNNLERYIKEYSKNKKTKEKMENIFGRKRILKGGKQGINYEYPNTLTLHTNKQYLEKWINYAVLDAESTYFLYVILKRKLMDVKTDIQEKQEPKDLWEFYQKYWLPFGEVLTKIEREGI